MTSNDRNSQVLLERELAELGRPDEGDERFRRALRAQLLAETRGQRRPKRRRRRRLIAAAAGAAVLTAAVTLVVGGGSSEPVAAAAVIRHARTAITPVTAAILHAKTIIEQNGSQIGASESWTLPRAADGLLTRIVLTSGHTGRPFELATDGTTTQLYDPATNTIYQRTIALPGPAPTEVVDPVSALRQQLDSGQATFVGTTTVDGTPAYEISFANGSNGDVDQRTYYPLRYENPTSNGTLEVRFLTYEYLPATPDNMALLNLGAQHPNATLDTNPADWPSGTLGYRPIGT